MGRLSRRRPKRQATALQNASDYAGADGIRRFWTAVPSSRDRFGPFSTEVPVSFDRSPLGEERALGVLVTGVTTIRQQGSVVVSRVKNWLSGMDSNHDKELQRLLCYHYTTGQGCAKGSFLALVAQRKSGGRGRPTDTVSRFNALTF